MVAIICYLIVGTLYSMILNRGLVELQKNYDFIANKKSFLLLMKAIVLWPALIVMSVKAAWEFRENINMGMELGRMVIINEYSEKESDK